MLHITQIETCGGKGNAHEFSDGSCQNLWYPWLVAASLYFLPLSSQGGLPSPYNITCHGNHCQPSLIHNDLTLIYFLWVDKNMEGHCTTQYGSHGVCTVLLEGLLSQVTSVMEKQAQTASQGYELPHCLLKHGIAVWWQSMKYTETLTPSPGAVGLWLEQ